MKLNHLVCLVILFLPIKAVFAMDPIQTALNNENYLFKIRNHLHENPEICWEEDQSLAYVKNELQKITPISGRELKISDHFEGGLVADLKVKDATKTLLFRADIDALPVTEDPSHSIISKVPGKMHACGHDVHSAMLLTAAKILLTDANVKPTSNIRFIWQRAEENPGSDPVRFSGAFTFVKEKVLENIDEVYGIHIWSKLPSGTVYSAPKAIMGTAGRVKIEIYTSGGHSSAPHQGTNALRVAHALMNALKEVHVRILGPTQPISLEPTILQSGTATNAMPAYAKMYYTLRTFLDPQPLSEFENQLQKIVQQVAEQYDAKIVADFGKGYPTTVNSTKLFNEQKIYLTENGLTVQETDPILAAEDFSYYLQQKPGVFWILGAEHKDSGPHHAPTFNPDTKAFHKGVALWLCLATQTQRVS